MISVDQVEVRESTQKDDTTSSSSSSSLTEDELDQKSSCNDIEDNSKVDTGYTQKVKHCAKLQPATKRSYQHFLPLYISFLCAITALTQSIITHKSTSFVTLTDPLNAGPFFKSINEIGLNYWKLCSIKQNGLDFILDHEKIMPSVDEDDEVVESSSSDIIKEGPRGPYIEANQDDDISYKETIMQDGSGQLLEVPPSISFIRTAHDIVRNVTSTVQTTYHNSYNSIQQQRGWYSEPNHDDILVSGDYLSLQQKERGKSW